MSGHTQVTSEVERYRNRLSDLVHKGLEASGEDPSIWAPDLVAEFESAVVRHALGYIAVELARGDREARDLIAKVKWPDCMAALVNLYSDVLRSINAYARPDGGNLEGLV